MTFYDQHRKFFWIFSWKEKKKKKNQTLNFPILEVILVS